MDITDIRSFCASLPGSWEDFPFDENTLVFKIGKKMYGLCPLSGSPRINLKCDPLIALELRKQYSFVHPGFHMNKQHWNTVEIGPHVSGDLLFPWIRDSYNLVIASMSGKERSRLSPNQG